MSLVGAWLISANIQRYPAFTESWSRWETIEDVKMWHQSDKISDILCYPMRFQCSAAASRRWYHILGNLPQPQGVELFDRKPLGACEELAQARLGLCCRGSKRVGMLKNAGSLLKILDMDVSAHGVSSTIAI